MAQHDYDHIMYIVCSFMQGNWYHSNSKFNFSNSYYYKTLFFTLHFFSKVEMTNYSIFRGFAQFMI